MVKSIEDIQYFSGCIVDVFKNKPIGEKENNGYEWDFIRIFSVQVWRTRSLKICHLQAGTQKKPVVWNWVRVSVREYPCCQSYSIAEEWELGDWYLGTLRDKILHLKWEQKQIQTPAPSNDEIIYIATGEGKFQTEDFRLKLWSLEDPPKVRLTLWFPIHQLKRKVIWKAE